MKKKVSIIGAGIAGMSVGSYLQMNGFETEIHELHNLPGGLCTSWQRNGYNIDGCIHWLVGSAEGQSLYNAWNELIDMKKLQIYDHDIFYQYEDESGKCIRFYNNIDLLEKELLDKAPEDRGVIRDYIHAARRFSAMKLPLGKPRELFTLKDMGETVFRLGPYLGLLNKWSKVSIADFAGRCRNPLLRKTIENLFVPEMGIVFVMITTAWMHNKTAGYPIGGSLAFSKLIEDRYLALGGRIHYHSRIEEIMTRSDGSRNQACGIKDSQGKEYPADFVVSAADGYTTLFRMLKGRFVDSKTNAFYNNNLLFPSYLQLSLGISRKLESSASSLIFPLTQAVKIDPANTLSEIGIRIHSFDPNLAPEGKTLITALIPSREHKYWVNLRTDEFDSYKEEKERIIRELVCGMEKRLGPLADYLEMKDLSTPATVIRYTNNWKGSFEGWIMTPSLGFRQLPLSLRGLDNFWMAGQWVSPGGGLPSALMTGRGVAEIICRKTGRKFKTESFSS